MVVELIFVFRSSELNISDDKMINDSRKVMIWSDQILLNYLSFVCITVCLYCIASYIGVHIFFTKVVKVKDRSEVYFLSKRFFIFILYFDFSFSSGFFLTDVQGNKKIKKNWQSTKNKKTTRSKKIWKIDKKY